MKVISENNDINWDNGQPVNLQTGVQAKATKLDGSQLYGLFFRNDGTKEATVTVNSQIAKIAVPGGTSGLPSVVIVFVYNVDTVTVKPDEVPDKGCVTALIGSVSLPINSVKNYNLELDKSQKFDDKVVRVYHSAPAQWQQERIENTSGAPFLVVRFRRSHALVTVFDDNTKQPWLPHVYAPKTNTMFTMVATTNKVLDEYFYGDSGQLVWLGMRASIPPECSDPTVAVKSWPQAKQR